MSTNTNYEKISGVRKTIYSTIIISAVWSENFHYLKQTENLFAEEMKISNILEIGKHNQSATVALSSKAETKRISILQMGYRGADTKKII